MESYESLVKIIREASAAERDEALGKLIRRFEGAAYRWAFDLLNDSHLAQDVVQESFITAYEHLDQLRDPAAFPGWFKRIVLMWCSRMTRRKKLPADALDEDTSVSHADPSEEFERRESKERIERALDNLPERERTVTELFYLDDYSQREIAERLRVPVTTVKKRLQYAREHLRGEYLRSGDFQNSLLNHPAITWLVSAQEQYLNMPAIDEPLDSVLSIVVEDQNMPVLAGYEPIPTYGRIVTPIGIRS